MLDDLFRPDPEQILKVAELTRQIKSHIETRFNRIWVQGEVSNLRRQSSGHVYFSLKDSRSQLPCVLFARDAASQTFELKDGMEVLLYGDLSVFEPHGRYQLIAKIAIQSGQGRLQLEFERLKKKLNKEGLFDKEKKRPLPIFPTKIAVVTSATGAAITDFLRILQRRNYKGQVVIFPAKVQGKEAAAEIVKMIEYASASTGFDLAVVTRGGGSIEDLWPFNEESVARAIAACPLPTISAVGHEIDIVLSDYVADKRAETPSAAAELISSTYLETTQKLEELQRSLKEAINASVNNFEYLVKSLDHRLQMIVPTRQLQIRSLIVDDLENRLQKSLYKRLRKETVRVNLSAQELAKYNPDSRILAASDRLNDTQRRLNQALTNGFNQKKQQLEHAKHRLKNGSLPATLKRGYAFVEKMDGSILDTANKTAAEKKATLNFFDGKVPILIKKMLKT